MLNPRIHIVCGMCGCNHMFEYEIVTEINDDTDEPEQVVYIVCKNCGSLTGLEEIIKEKKKKEIEKELTEDEKFWKEHKLGDEYQMDGKPDKWKIVYYPIFEDGKTNEKYNESRALVEKPIVGGTDFREIPLRYLTKFIK